MDLLGQCQSFVGRTHGLSCCVRGQVDVGQHPNGAHLCGLVPGFPQLRAHLLGCLCGALEVFLIAEEVRNHIQGASLARSVLGLHRDLLGLPGHSHGVIILFFAAVDGGHRQQAGRLFDLVADLLEDGALLLGDLHGLVQVVLGQSHLGEGVHAHGLPLSILEVLVNGNGIIRSHGSFLVGLSQHVNRGEFLQDASFPPLVANLLHDCLGLLHDAHGLLAVVLRDERGGKGAERHHLPTLVLLQLEVFARLLGYDHGLLGITFGDVCLHQAVVGM
mmetsp:Transcript_81414/g.146998  ORF Transcript_81414/g.146998 Transcript_81414/m.146998 type:complete len:275 (+) Transcript_81414:784-1608(+)